MLESITIWPKEKKLHESKNTLVQWGEDKIQDSSEDGRTSLFFDQGGDGICGLEEGTKLLREFRRVVKGPSEDEGMVYVSVGNFLFSMLLVILLGVMKGCGLDLFSLFRFFLK